MAGHGPRLDAVYANLVLQIPTPAVGDGSSGSVNFIGLDRFTAWLADPTSANADRCLEFLAEQREHGHLTLRKKDDPETGWPTYATEQASPGMHGEYNFAGPAGCMLRAKPSSELYAACRQWVLDDLALCREFRFQGGVYIPAPRVKEGGIGAMKGQNSAHTGREPMLPWDGYRDARLALALGEAVKRKNDYWTSPQSVGVWCMRGLAGAGPAKVSREDVRRHPVPKLFIPVHRASLPAGGFLAWLEDSPVARENTIDVCNWCTVRPEDVKVKRSRTGGSAVECGYDWAPLQDIETVPGSEVTYGR